MKPRANRALAKCPAKGLSASAAWAALWMFVSLWACSVSAVATMMANMTRLENVMPTKTSSLLVRCLRWARAGLWRLRGCALAPPSGSSRISSRRCALCQKKRYGEMVVPSTATRSAR